MLHGSRKSCHDALSAVNNQWRIRPLKRDWAHSCNVQQKLYIKKGGARAPASAPLNPPLKSIIIIILRLLRGRGSSSHAERGTESL